MKSKIVHFANCSMGSLFTDSLSKTIIAKETWGIRYEWAVMEPSPSDDLLSDASRPGSGGCSTCTCYSRDSLSLGSNTSVGTC